MTTTVLVARVFADEHERHGNELGVIVDGGGLDGALGPRLTAHLGFSETVFVDAVTEDGADLRIFNPTAEMKLGGHPLVGTAHLLARMTAPRLTTLRPRLADPVATWREGAVTWIRANCADAPDFSFEQLATPAEVEALPVPPPGEKAFVQYWAWIDESAGLLRARTFAGAIDVPEDEATGSAAMLQAQRLGRALTIRQGRGSVLHVRPAAGQPGWSELGGRVASEPSRVVDTLMP